MLSSLELLQKYDLPGPRYTSYPTVPAWTNSVTVEDFISNLKKISSSDKVSLYFHMPFCENRCHFCGCSRQNTKDRTLSAAYTKDIISEMLLIAQYIEKKPCVTQMHFGGGSPNFFQPEELSQILNQVRQSFSVLPEAELAVEINPKTTSRTFCDTLITEKFNRISIGVQDFDPHVQKLINRFQSFEITKDIVEYLRKNYITHFNFDLVYGLPGQTKTSFAKTLDQVAVLNPNRLAVYSYAHIPWIHQEQRSFQESDLPSPALKLELFTLAMDFFTTHGYHQIGMDHFARDDDDLYLALKNHSVHRNFMGYSTQAEAHQIGMGATSISCVNGNYFQNQKDIALYQKTIREKRLTTTKGFILSDDDHIRRELITELMCHLSINKSAFEAAHNICFDDYFSKELCFLEDFEKNGLLERSSTHLKIIKQGCFVVRNIAMCFDNYLENINKNRGQPAFSRTV